MREIKFRGKNKDLGFVEGQLAFDENNNTYIIHKVEMDSSYGLEETMLFATMWYRVNKDTVGQFTGLKDKNGVEIYEGDIVRILGGEYEQGFYEWDEKVCIKDFIYDGFNLMMTVNQIGNEALEVIGNIYDNPELIENT